MLKIPNDRSCFYQWDLNQKLIVNDTIHNQVHFADADDSIALVKEIYEKDGQRYVDIPNIFFQNSGRLYAYVCGSSEIEDHTHAVYKFKIKDRPKPDDYVYTETEIIIVEKLQNRMTDLENRMLELEDNSVSEDELADAVNDYLNENPVGSSLNITTWTEEELEAMN